MQVINAVAEFERDLLIERTNAGIKRAKSAGTKFGRPSTLTSGQQTELINQLKDGTSVSQLARMYKTSRQTVMRVRNASMP